MSKVRGCIVLLRAVWIAAACAFQAVACGGGGSSPNDPPPLDPPPNIDAVSCYAFTSAPYTVSMECSGCCTENGFQGATTYGGHCVCGNPLDTQGDSVCADQAASFDLCQSCCTDAGYSGALGGGGTCFCHYRTDTAVCASALAAAMPATACQPCCLNNGYLGSGYTGIGTPECRCIDP
jgi:hypothetical protein